MLIINDLLRQQNCKQRNINNNKLNEFDSWLKLSDLVIRHMIVRIEKEPDVLEKVDNESPLEEKEDLKSDKDKISKEKIDEETQGVE